MSARKSFAARVIDGNPGHRPLPRDIKAPPGTPVMPRGMLPEAQKVWRSTVKQMKALGLLTELDGIVLELYCTTYARWRMIQAQLNEPLTAEQIESGLDHFHATVEARNAGAQVRQLATELGLTPASRSRIHPQMPDADKPTGGVR